MYKNYKVREIILNDYEHPETITVVDGVTCGCSQCENAGEIQPGHFACGLLPQDLLHDENILPRLERGAWYPQFVGDVELVDEWLETTN